MPTYYIFCGTTGTAVMVTDDRTGKKLPNHPLHPSARWVPFRSITLNRGDKAKIGASSDTVIDAIEKNGYFRWPPAKAVAPKTAPTKKKESK
jgi:hypothetical protein